MLYEEAPLHERCFSCHSERSEESDHESLPFYIGYHSAKCFIDILRKLRYDVHVEKERE